MRNVGSAYSELLKVIGGLFLILDGNSLVLEVNRQGLKRLGYPKRGFIGQQWPDVFMRQETAQQFRTAMANSAETGEVVELECPVIRPSGRERVYSWRVMAQKQAGIITGYLCAGQDITLVRDMESAWHYSENMTRVLLNASRYGAFLLSNDGRILSSNEVGTELFGTSPEEAHRKLLWEITPAKLTEQFKQWFRETVNTAQSRVHKAQWNDRVFTVGIFPVVNNQGFVERVGYFVRDVTERLNLEDALRRSTEKYRQLFENANDVIYIHDLDWNIITANKTAERVLGYTEAEFVGMNIGDLLDEKSRLVGQQMFKDKILGKRGSTIYETIVLAKDGHAINMEINTSVIYENGVPVAVQGIARDITERKRMHAQLQYLSMHDSLTGLYNRAYFTERMMKLENSVVSVGLLICDIDGMKRINDTLGHDAGDQVLMTTAEILTSSVDEKAVVSRIGGDEFAIFVENASMQVLTGIKDTIEETAVQRNRTAEIQLGISVGFAIRTAGENKPLTEVFREADAEMYKEKRMRYSRRSSV